MRCITFLNFQNSLQQKICHAFQIFGKIILQVYSSPKIIPNTHLDMDGDGVISRNDLKNMLNQITDTVIEEEKKDIIIQSVRLI